jgi:hypothetical protein
MESTDSLIVVNDHLALHAVDERFVHDLHQLIVKNREWLQHFLTGRSMSARLTRPGKPRKAILSCISAATPKCS